MDEKCASLHSCWITLSVRSMKTAQPGIVRGKNNQMFMEFFCVQVHVLDVYIEVCMQRSTTCILPFNERKESDKKSEKILKHEML